MDKDILRKNFKFLISDRLPNGVIATVEFGTDRETVWDFDKADDFFQLIYESTMRDIKWCKDKNPIIASMWRKMLDGFKQRKKAEEGKKSLEDS